MRTLLTALALAPAALGIVACGGDDDDGGGEKTNGPNFNVRKENEDDILFAIRNGGFSGAIMPANIAVGQDAEDIATFLEKYAGRGGSDVTEQQSSNQGQ